jgi:hypothetical protein
MTPKEKAKELYDKYEKMYPLNFTKAGENFHKSNIIKCALIAVDFAMNSKYSFQPMNGGWVSGRKYYEELKEEIEKL